MPRFPSTFVTFSANWFSRGVDPPFATSISSTSLNTAMRSAASSGVISNGGRPSRRKWIGSKKCRNGCATIMNPPTSSSTRRSSAVRRIPVRKRPRHENFRPRCMYALLQLERCRLAFGQCEQRRPGPRQVHRLRSGARQSVAIDLQALEHLVRSVLEYVVQVFFSHRLRPLQPLGQTFAVRAVVKVLGRYRLVHPLRLIRQLDRRYQKQKPSRERVWERRNTLSAPLSQGRPAGQEERHIGADLCRGFRDPLPFPA